MSTKIREYKESDYDTVLNWLKDENFTPSKDLMSKSSTFVLEENNVPLFCITIYLTNCKEVCFIENFAGNPDFKKERQKHSQLLFTYMENLAKDLGYKSILCFSGVEKLTQKYEEYGYKRIMNNLTALGKVL